MGMTHWVIKLPTKLDKRTLGPIEVDSGQYTVCREDESMYDGSYPKSFEIVCYYAPFYNSEVVVPYRAKHADDQYGYYEFETRKQLIQWAEKNPNDAKFFINKQPECFI